MPSPSPPLTSSPAVLQIDLCSRQGSCPAPHGEKHACLHAGAPCGDGSKKPEGQLSSASRINTLPLPARPLTEMPRLTSPSLQMPAEADCSEPTLLAPPPPFPFSSIPLRPVLFQAAKITCPASAAGEVGKGGLTGRPKAFRGFSAPCTLTARPRSVLRGGAHPPRPEIQRSCKAAPALAGGSFHVLETKTLFHFLLSFAGFP